MKKPALTVVTPPPSKPKAEAKSKKSIPEKALDEKAKLKLVPPKEPTVEKIPAQKPPPVESPETSRAHLSDPALVAEGGPKPKSGGLRARVKKSSAATAKKKATRRRGNKVDKPKPTKPKPYAHLIGEDSVDIPGFGVKKIQRVLSLPGLAYFENQGVMYLLHMKSLKPLPFPVKNDYLVEKVCERFRHVPWNESLDWFRTPKGKEVRAEMEAFIKELN